MNNIIKWKKNKNFQPGIIIQKLNEVKNIGANGASIPAFEATESEAILMSMLDFGSIISEMTKHRLLGKALHNTLQQENPTKENFLDNINWEHKQFSKTKDIDYFFLSSLSITSVPFAQIEICGCKIKFLKAGKSFPRKFSSRNELTSKWNNQNFHTPETYVKIIVKAAAKDPYDAVTRALFAIDVLRSILCLLCNAHMTIEFGNSRKRINTISLGGAHTLHLESGVGATEFFWYEGDYSAQSAFSQDKTIEFLKNVRWCIARLKKIRYSEIFNDALVRYVRAYDEVDSNSTIMHAWGALEALLSPHENNFDKVIKRCIFIYDDRDYAKQTLEHLREYRNSSVHSGESLSDPKTHCYQMQKFFRNLIFFHLRNIKYFSTIEEINYFLDLTPDSEILENRIKFHKKALRLLK